MPKRNSFIIRKKILHLLKDSPMTLAQLERKVNTNSRTVKRDCEELEYYSLVSIQKQTHPSNGRLSYLVKITKNGLEIINQ